MNQSPEPTEQLGKRIKALRNKLEGKEPTSNAGVSHGMRAGLDLVSGVAVGTAIGYGLDSWLNTLPLAMLICMGIGTAAGVKLMMETSRRAAELLEREENKGEQ